MSENPFEILNKKTKFQSNDFNENDNYAFNSLIEEICLVTVDRISNNNENSKLKPKYLYYIGESVEYSSFNLDNIENIIFERLFLMVNVKNVVNIENGYNVDMELVIDSNPINYLFHCFIRTMNFISNTINNSKVCAETIKNAILNQTSIYVQNSCEITPKEVAVHLYDCIVNNSSDSNCLTFFSELFKGIDKIAQDHNDTKNSLFYFQEFFQYFLTQTFCNKPPPFSNVLGIWKDPLQTLYCPERKKFVMMMSILSNIPVAAEMILDFSSRNERGIDFERCLLGRFLCATHLPSGIMQSAEFFNKMPITVQEKQSEEQTIWQLTKLSLTDSCDIFMSIFQSSKYRPEIKNKLLRWFGQCIYMNKGRNQLLNSLNNIPSQTSQLASDGFFMNVINVLFHIANPLLNPQSDKIFSIQLEFTDQKEQNEEILPELSKETRLIPMNGTVKSQLKFPEKYTVLTQLFYLVHKAYQLSFHVLQAKFMELNQQLHRIQSLYDDILNGGGSNTPEGEQLKKMITSQMSQYMSLNSAMRLPDFMAKSSALVEASCRLLVKIGRSDKDSDFAQKIFCVPEFVMDNIVDFLTFLRHFDDSFYETGGFNLNSLLEMVVLYMGSTTRLKNPHLRSKIATLLECLIPQRDEAPTQNGPMTFYMREQLFTGNDNWTHDYIIEALFSAFTTMELSAGEENVRFEEKFEYRRPMYACMRFFYNKPKFDNQIRKLEEDALENINNVEAPLCLKFLNLLINDATYLLDEALNYLGQLKHKEKERMSHGGKFTNQTEEGNFQHMVLLAKYHNSLATETIDQLNRMATLCPNIMVHPILIDRIACTLNYFLDHLVGPKRSNLMVMDKEAYAFKPKQLVKIIAQIYVSLGNRAEFCNAVVNDGRSYSDKLLETASNLMGKVSNNDMNLFTKFEDLTNRLKICSANQNEENENFENAPEEFVDPIMGTVMRDPVTLPSSGINVDKTTIFRHLLSDPTDPFNRQSLTMSDVKPNEELKSKILDWIAKQKH